MGVAYDYWSEKAREAWERIFGESRAKRGELRKEIEKERVKYVEKDGFRFKLWEGGEDPKKLEEYVAGHPERVEVKRFNEKTEGVVTAARMVDQFMKDGYGQDEKLWMKHYILSESSCESDHDYGALGRPIRNESSRYFGTRALGRYQVMPKNWVAWSKEIFDGKVVAPTPQAQEYVAFVRFKSMYDRSKEAIARGRPFEKYRKDVFYSMACVWYSGHYSEVNIRKLDWNIVLASSGEIDSYAQGVLNEMGFAETAGTDYIKWGGSRAKEYLKKLRKR